jgi:hypothetical protein
LTAQIFLCYDILVMHFGRFRPNLHLIFSLKFVLILGGAMGFSKTLVVAAVERLGCASVRFIGD